MKLIKAYIRNIKVEEVYNALREKGYCCMTFVECEGTGQYSDKEKTHFSSKYPFTDSYKVIKIEIIIKEEHLDEVVSLIRKAGSTGYNGDGIIACSTIDNIYRVRNNEQGKIVL